MSTANSQIRYQGKTQFNTMFGIGNFVSKEKLKTLLKYHT